MRTARKTILVRVRAGIAVFTVVAALAPMAPRAGAHLAGDIENATARIEELTTLISSQQAEVKSLQTRMKDMSVRVANQRAALGVVAADLDVTRGELENKREEHTMLKGRMEARARSMYMRGPLEFLGLLVGAESVGEFTQQVGYASRMARQDNQLVSDVRRVQGELVEVEAEQEDLKQQHEGALAALTRQQRALNGAFANTQAKLAALSKSKSEALHLLEELKDRLDSGQYESLRRVAGSGMTVSYGSWANAFLAALGAPANRNNLVAVVAWEAAESTQATWNPLATTKSMPSCETGIHTSHGVRNYDSMACGIEATIATLRLPSRGYEPILTRLASGAESMRTAEAIRASRWCAGCAGGTYVVGFIEAVEQYYDRYANG